MSYHSYETYDAMLTGRCAQRKKLTNNTYLERRGGDIAVRLHDTDVVVYRRSGTISLHTGGWLTVTTKERINRYSPASVYSIKGRWMLCLGTDWDHAVPFAEGVTLHPDGTITGAAADRDIVAQDRANVKVKRDIKKFVDAVTPERIITAWENSGGDCWGCSMVADDGTYPMGRDCLREHVRDNYFHAHLALRALKAQGYRMPEVNMQMIYGDAQRGRVDNILTRALTKFLRANLLEGVATPGKKGRAA